LLSACASNDSKCVMCQLRINPATNPGRVLTRSNYELYGIDAKRQGADCKICTKCKDEVLKIRNSGRCMVKMCASGKRKVKATKTMPTKWRQMDDRQRTFILSHLSIPREIVKCCGPCFKRISKKLDLLFAGDLEEEMAKFELEVHQTWQSGEISRLQNLVAQFGTDWCSVSAQMHGRSADDCRLQYESLSKKEEEEEEDFEEEADGDKCERQDDDVPMEEDTQDCPETSILTARDDDMDTDIVELPTTSQESTLRNSPIDMNAKEDSQMLVDHHSTYADIGKGSITAGTPLRPPSVSIIEQQATISQLNAVGATAASQPSTTPSVLTGFDQNTLLQIHTLFGGGDETRTRAILDQFQQQRNYQFQQQFIQQQPLLDQLFLTYSQFSDADLNRIYLAADVTTRCVIEAILQHKKQAVNLQMRQQHAAMVADILCVQSQIQAKQLELRQMEQQREEQRLQQEKQRQIDATKRRLQEQIKHHDITAANIEKNKAAMVNRVGEINQSLQTASLTQLQRQQLLLEYSSQSAKCSSLQSMAQNHRMQRTQLQNQLDALNTGNGSAAVVASMSLSSSPVIYRMHDTSVQMDDEQRLREEIEKIDEDIRGMEKQVRRLEEDERTYQKKKIQAEQMITSAFRINSTMQDYQAKQDLKEAQDNMRVAEHSRLTFQKKLDNLRESRELLVRQQRMLLNSSNTSGVIVGSSGAVSKGAVKDFAQQQSVKAVQPPTTISLATQHYQLQIQQQQQQQQPQQQQQQQKTPIGIRQPTADSKPNLQPTTTQSCWPGINKDRDNAQWLENKRSFNTVLDRVVHKELSNSHSTASHTSQSSVGTQEIRRKSGLEMLNIPSVSVSRHPHRRPISPAVGAMSPSLSTATPSTTSAHIQQSLASCSPAGSSTAQPKASPNDTNVPAACTLPPPALQFLATSNVSGPLTYEPISPDDNAPKSPFARAEAPSSTPASSGGSRMFSALDFDFPLAVAPTVITPTPNPPSLAPPLAELLRAAGSDAITTVMTFEPLSDDDD
uniref:SANT domain-containing protein n=1 Tax=Angiostrongylus cantonensis TaxID=6313 RepID=A0A0K0DJV0_ANGCA